MDENQKKEKQKEALQKLKAVYDDKCAEINGRSYRFLATTHQKRRRIFAYYSSVSHLLDSKNLNFGFMGTEEFEEIENLISQMVTYENETLNKRPTHWEQFPDDYILFITTAMGVISYPFLSANLTA